MAISPAYITQIKSVRSGFALSPSNPNVREALLQAANGLFLTGAKLEPAENLIPLLIPTVPAFIYTDIGRVVVTQEFLADEIERVSSVRPTSLKLFGSLNHHAPHRTWLGLFSKAPRPGFRVFDESGLAKVFKKQDPIDSCEMQWPPLIKESFKSAFLRKLRLDHAYSRGMPSPHSMQKLGSPTKEQLKIYCQAGDREDQAVIQAKAAEARAATAEEAVNVAYSSQSWEAVVNETQGSPAGTSTDDSMRL
ncbi:hypothetical protein K3495_g2461 [Podosphaera aphanis]|nr:hypothetical protein K3495_g2461 [Podosphaera aphanis]